MSLRSFSRFFTCHSHSLPALHSFPTRRSSDLSRTFTCDPGSDSAVGSWIEWSTPASNVGAGLLTQPVAMAQAQAADRKSTRLNSSHLVISYAVFCFKIKQGIHNTWTNISVSDR